MEALALHFPRERNGRFLRAAVWVTLASLDGAPPHLRGALVHRPRTKADDLYVSASRTSSAPTRPTVGIRCRGCGTAAGANALAEGLAAARQHRAGAALAGGPLWSRAGWPRSLDEYAAHFQGPTLRARGITIPNRLGKMRTSPGGRQTQYCAMARPRMISLDRRQARNRHLAAQPDQTTFAL